MKASKRIFAAAWEYPPIMSGESVVCRKTLEHSKFDYDLCCGPVDGISNAHIRLFPFGGNKYLSWPFAAAKQFKKLDAQEDYEVMMSRVMPPNGHFAGWLIKRIKPQIKWIVYFSDPIWNSPFLKFSLWRSKDHRPNWLLMKLFGIPAKWAIREGDLLVFNNERLARYVLGSRYEQFREKVAIVPYGHEGIHPRPAPNRNDGKFRLTHVGQLYGNRTLTALLEGVKILQKQSPEEYARLQIRQVGFASEAERKRVENSAVAETFEFIGQVAYEESIEEMYQADCLLVIDPIFDSEEKNIYIPGKIFDYMSTGRPVFCVAAENSATGDVAKKTGYWLADPKDVASICSALKKLIGGGPLAADSTSVEPFCCQCGVDVLDYAICEMAKKRRNE